MLCAPLAHAVLTHRLTPRQPVSIAIMPAAMFGMIIGTVSGANLPGPRVRNTSCSVSSMSKPPMPEPTITATSSRPSSGSAAWRTASIAATSASWVKRAERRTVLESSRLSASRSSTSPAMRLRSAEASKRVIGPMPERPAFSASQNTGTPVPTGAATPRPVTTTRGRTVSPSRIVRDQTTSNENVFARLRLSMSSATSEACGMARIFSCAAPDLVEPLERVDRPEADLLLDDLQVVARAVDAGAADHVGHLAEVRHADARHVDRRHDSRRRLERAVRVAREHFLEDRAVERVVPRLFLRDVRDSTVRSSARTRSRACRCWRGSPASRAPAASCRRTRGTGPCPTSGSKPPAGTRTACARAPGCRGCGCRACSRAAPRRAGPPPPSTGWSTSTRTCRSPRYTASRRWKCGSPSSVSRLSASATRQ